MQKVLIIDDELAVRKAFCLALEDDYLVDTADCGETGVAMVQNNDYQLIFTDLKMPGISGVETLTQIRTLGKTMPIYVVTAFHKEFFDELAVAQKKGFSFQLARKPLGIDDIQSIVNAVLKNGS